MKEGTKEIQEKEEVKVDKKPVPKRKENDKTDENKKENQVKLRTRLNATNLEPKPASTPPKKGAKPKKIQLNDGVVGLKRLLELKAQARYRPDAESDKNCRIFASLS